MEESERIDKKLKENLKPLNESLATLKALRSRLDATSTQDKPFYELKSELRSAAPELFTKLGLESAQTPEDIHRILRLHEVRVLEQIDDLEQEASNTKAELIADLMARAKEKDAIKKATLTVISEMGVDTLPQQETDSVFEWLNNNPAVREGL